MFARNASMSAPIVFGLAALGLACLVFGLPEADAAVLFEEDFATDPNQNPCWTIYRNQGSLTTEAVWSASGYLSFTMMNSWSTSVIVPCVTLPAGAWNMSYDYWVDSSNGADGISYMFYKDFGYLPTTSTGWSMGVSDRATPYRAGYAVVVDNYYDSVSFDPSGGTYLGTIGGDLRDHRVSVAPFPQAEDGQWHNVLVDHCGASVIVSVDGVQMLTDPGPFSTNFANFGFSASNGVDFHEQRIDDILLTDCMAATPPPPPPPPPPAPPPTPSDPAPLIADPGGPYAGSVGTQVTIRGRGLRGAGGPYTCLWTGNVGFVASTSCTTAVYSDRPGHFVLTLRVTDSQGHQAWESTAVTVSEPGQDSDMDGVDDFADNCPSAPNHDQGDFDQDGVGDACDPGACYYDNESQAGECNRGPASAPQTTAPGPADQDGDGQVDEMDNCPEFPNMGQADRDGDNIGDLCDQDIDGDGLANASDNCPLRPNPDQKASDREGQGDLCGTLVSAPGVETKVGPPSAVADERNRRAKQMWQMGLVASAFVVVGIAALLLVVRLRRN